METRLDLDSPLEWFPLSKPLFGEDNGTSPQILSELQRNFILLESPCNSGKSTFIVNNIRRIQKPIFIVPSKILCSNLVRKFLDEGVKVHVTSFFEEYFSAGTFSSLDYKSPFDKISEADVAVFTYDAFYRRFENSIDELRGACIICDEAHRLLKPDNSRDLDFLRQCRSVTGEYVFFLSATWDETGQYIQKDKETEGVFRFPVKKLANIEDLRCNQFVTGYQGPAVKGLEDFIIKDLGLDEVVSNINLSSVLTRVAVQSNGQLIKFLYGLDSTKRIGIIASKAKQKVLTNKFNLPQLLFFKGGLLDDWIVNHNLDVILHTNSLEDGYSINIPHRTYYLGGGFEFNQKNISLGSIIQTFNRNRTDNRGIEEPFIFCYGSLGKVYPKPVLEQIIVGPWIEENPFRIFHFTPKVAFKLYKLRPELFEDSESFLTHLPWFYLSPDYEEMDIEKERYKMFSALFIMIRNSFLYYEDLYFDDYKPFDDGTREYNAIVTSPSLFRYKTTVEINKWCHTEGWNGFKFKPLKAVEFDLVSCFSAILFDYCGKSNEFEKFLEERDAHGLKIASSSLLNGLGYKELIKDLKVKDYIDSVGMQANDSLLLKISKFFGIPVENFPEDLKLLFKHRLYKGDIFRFFALKERQIITKAAEELQSYLRSVHGEKVPFLFSRQHDGLRVWTNYKGIESLDNFGERILKDATGFTFRKVNYDEEVQKKSDKVFNGVFIGSLENPFNFISSCGAKEVVLKRNRVSTSTVLKTEFRQEIIKRYGLIKDKKALQEAISELASDFDNVYTPDDYIKIRRLMKENEKS